MRVGLGAARMIQPAQEAELVAERAERLGRFAEDELAVLARPREPAPLVDAVLGPGQRHAVGRVDGAEAARDVVCRPPRPWRRGPARPGPCRRRPGERPGGQVRNAGSSDCPPEGMSTFPGTSGCYDVPDHVLHAVAVGLQLQPRLASKIQFIIGQAAAGGVGRQVLEDAEGDLIDAVFGQILLQVVDAADLGPVGQGGTGIDRRPSSAARRRRIPRSAMPHGSILRGTGAQPGWLRCCSSPLAQR